MACNCKPKHFDFGEQMRISKLFYLCHVVLFTLVACSSTDNNGPEPLKDLEYRLFDCRADQPPTRTSKVALDCIIDEGCTQRLVTGHRGAGGELGLFTPENSLSGIRLAILMGVDTIEIDVRHTSDDQLVLMHDASLERTTGIDKNVDEMTLEQITQIPLLVDGYLGDFSCERVPSFEEVLKLAKGRINIDIDTKTDRADLVAKAIRDSDMLDQAFVSTPDIQSAELARNTVPEVMIQARPKDIQDYQTSWAELSPPAQIIEVEQSQIDDFKQIAQKSGSKLLANAFWKDALVLTGGDTSAYLDIYDDGFDDIQSEYPNWVLDVLGRNYWASWPPYRDIGIDSPLFGD